MKKTAFLLTLLILSLLCCAAADTLSLPPSLTEIGEEAFMGDLSVTGITLPDTLESIGDRAFMGCDNLTEITIPSSVVWIGQDALPPQALVRCDPGSAAWDYAVANGLQYASQRLYAVSSVWATYDYEIGVSVTAEAACTLRVDILDVDRQTVLCTATADCGAGLTAEPVLVSPESLPEYYAVRAVLEDGEGGALCEPFLWLEPLGSYLEFENKTPGDFSAGKTLDYGANGFAVLRSDVREAHGTESGGVYTVYSEDEIYEWDRLYIPEANALLIARGVTDNGDGSYSLTAYDGEEIGLGDFFQYVNYKANVDAVPRTRGAAGGGADLARFTAGYTLGSVAAEVSVGASVNVSVRYDAALFGGWHVECDVWAQTDANIKLTASKSYELNRELPLFTYMVPTEIPFLLISMDMSLPIELSAKAEAEASAHAAARLGFRYNSDSGFTPLHDAEAGWDVTAKAEFGCKTGPKVAVGLTLARVLTASVSAQAGVDITVSATLADAHSGPLPEKKHACALCFDVDVNKFVTLDAGLYALTETLDEHNLYEYSNPIFDGFLSVVNDEDSVLGGRVTLREGECPNCKYRATLRVEDPDAPGEIKHAAIWRTPDGAEREQMAAGDAPLAVMLYPGRYVAESEHMGFPEVMDFEIADEPLDLLMDFTLIPIDEAHFPDAAFRKYVADNYDKNGDLLLNGWERSRVRKMQMMPAENDPDWLIHFPAYCTSLEGIRYFTEVTDIYFDHVYTGYIDDGGNWVHDPIARIDLSQNTKLTRVELWLVGPDGVDVSGCAALRDLKILGGTGMTALDVSGCPLLENLELGNAGWYEGDEFVGGYRALTELDLSHNPALRNLRLEDCIALTSLDLSGHSALEVANFEESGLTSLKVDGCTSLTTLILNHTRLSYLDLTVCPRINGVSIRNVPGMTLNVSHKYCSSDHLGQYVDVAWSCDQNQRIYSAEGVTYGVWEGEGWHEYHSWD